MYSRLNIQDRVPANPGRVTLAPVSGQTNTYDMALADNPTQTGNIINGAVFTHLEDGISELDALRADTIRGCTATPSFNSDGTPSQVVHKNSGGATVRTDVFSYATNLITEVRTLVSTGATITYKYHLDTQVTEAV